MSQEIDYAAVLEDLEAKRSALDTTIAGIKMMLGQEVENPGQLDGNKATPSASGPKEVKPGTFHGMSIAEAARVYLEMTKQKQTTPELGEALKRGGIESQSKDFIRTVYTILAARPRVFLRLGMHWALAEWYPNRAASSAALAPKKIKKAKKKPKVVVKTGKAPAEKATGKPQEFAG